MRPLDPLLLEALRDLARGFEARDARFCIIGALVPYGLEHDGTSVPFEMTTAYMLGIDSRPFDDEALRRPLPYRSHS